MIRGTRPTVVGHVLALTLSGLAASSSGCVGLIGGAPSQPQEQNPNGPMEQPTADAGVMRPRDPGRVTIHRLNRAEYNNTVRDLLGTAQRPADEFPADDRGYGFDNIADVLSLSPLQFEMYHRAAEALVDEAMRGPGPSARRTQVEAETLTGSVGAADGNAWLLWSNGDVTATIDAAAPGRYRLAVRAWQRRGGAEAARMAIELDGVAVREFPVPNEAASPGEFSVEANIARAGQVRVGASFLNDYLDRAAGEDRNLYVDWIALEGPLDAAGGENPARARILTCDPAAMGEAACAREVITRFGRRAWRRPLTEAEVTELAGFLDVARMHRGGFEQGIRLALQAMLVSPHFVFRVELDPDPTSPVAHPLSDHELAARLSYFLWSSMPDAALDAVADAGRLRDPAVLRAEAERMLADPRSRALVDNFAGQWLHTRALAEHEPDRELFPGYDAALRDAFRAETEAYFDAFLRGDLGMDQFLTSGFTFVDDRLAAYYGLAAPPGTGLRRVSLAGSQRAGLLTQGSLLTITSHPERTSPVRRGQWVLQQLLCTPPPPPPPGVEGLAMEATPTGSLRQRMEQHRTNPTCAACHAMMDPIGFGLENFDAVGAYRTMETGGFEIDASGELPGGARFDGAAELSAQLARDPRLPRCVAQQVMTYALGRGMQPNDNRALDELAAEWVSGGMRLRDLLLRVILSDAFRMRRGEPIEMGGGR